MDLKSFLFSPSFLCVFLSSPSLSFPSSYLSLSSLHFLLRHLCPFFLFFIPTLRPLFFFLFTPSLIFSFFPFPFILFFLLPFFLFLFFPFFPFYSCFLYSSSHFFISFFFLILHFFPSCLCPSFPLPFLFPTPPI